jgi:hypothetical protein
MTDYRTRPARLAHDFVVLNESLRAGGDRAAALQRLVALAVTTVPGCDWAAVTDWPARAEPHSLAYTAPAALAADQLQYEIRDGPCLSAATTDDGTVHVPDVGQETRWPAFCAAARARTPVRGVLSFHLAGHPGRCALNLYSAEPHSFDADIVAVASLFAAHARVLLLHADALDRAAQLTRALDTSRQIGSAVGILMTVHRITAEDAFTLLRTTSQRLNRKLRLVADDVVRTGALPDR